MACNCRKRVEVTKEGDPDLGRTAVLTGKTSMWPTEEMEIEFDDEINSGYRFKYYEPFELEVIEE